MRWIFVKQKDEVVINNNNFYIKIIKSIGAGFSPLFYVKSVIAKSEAMKQSQILKTILSAKCVILNEIK